MNPQQVKYLVAALTLGALIDCGASQNRSRQSPGAAQSEADAPLPLLPADPRAQIQALDDRIARSRAQLQLSDPIVTIAGAAPANPMADSSTDGTTVPPLPQACRQSLRPLCTDNCTLGAAICDDAGKLCELSKQLQPDAWAETKCNGAKQSCDAAIKRCCECR